MSDTIPQDRFLGGRSAVVTGGGRGIGAEAARWLGRAGASVLVAARTREHVDAVAAELRAAGAPAWGAVCDVADPESVQALAAEAADRLGRVDILVNNAGVAGSAPLKRTTLEEWNRMMAVNATGPFLCTRAFLPGMMERRWGRVVNVASVAGLHGARYVAAYTASKHAVVGFTRSVAAEVASGDTEVTVNAVCPGYVDTDMTRETVERVVNRTGMPEEQAIAAVLGSAAQRRLIQPEEIAFAVLQLCGHEARGINGQCIVVDGGALLG
jgi:3-hydroxybutyrate dehydrogenase